MAVLKVNAVAAKVREYNGNLAAVARHFGVTRSAVHHFVHARSSLLAVCQEARESMKDHAESALHRAVLAGEGWAIRFYLKTQAKDRGYVERVEVQTPATDEQADAALDAEIEARIDELARQQAAARRNGQAPPEGGNGEAGPGG